MHTPLSSIQSWITRRLCQLREARRLRRGLQEIAAMGAAELRDLGLTDTAAAIAAARAGTCCA